MFVRSILNERMRKNPGSGDRFWSTHGPIEYRPVSPLLTPHDKFAIITEDSKRLEAAYVDFHNTNDPWRSDCHPRKDLFGIPARSWYPFPRIAEDSQITLKTLVDSDKKEFINLLKHISERAKKAGLTESDISAAVQQVRSKRS